jgi:Spy/CpxP family protein refolding chaperone
MKTIILTFAIVASFTGSVFAQRGNAPYGPAQRNPTQRAPIVIPAPTPQPKVTARADNALDIYQINQLDNIVNLSFQQEKALNRIENQYDKLIAKANKRPFGQNVQQLERQKQQDMLAVLTPAQRQKLIAYQNGNRLDRRGGFGRHS